MKKFEVVCFGSAVVDAFVKTDFEENSNNIIIPYGCKMLMKDLYFEIGGGGTNTSVAFSRLGLKTGYIGKVGSDENGNKVLNLLKKEKIVFLGSRVKEETSGFSVVLVSKKLNRSIITYKGINGFEPKEFIITIHCKKRVKKIEEVANKYKKLYWVWNGEAYDVGVKKIQTKSVGLRSFIRTLNLKKKNVLAIGDNYNDKELIEEAQISVSADKSRLKADFYVPLKGKFLPADLLMQQIIRERAKR